jgi:hypothetical protein
MEHAKLANGNRRLSSVKHASQRVEKNQKNAAQSNGKTALRKKAEAANTKPGQPLRKETGRKPKAEKLVCRYCGSDDLAPSFIKRRDRRCRKCFGKRYGSAARAKRARIKK